MKISAIDIENYKTIRKISLKSIPNFMVIAGPNGVGKTAVLEAIRDVKSFLYPYSNDERRLFENPLYRTKILRKGSKSLKVILEIKAISENEKNLMADEKSAKIGFEFDGINLNRIESLSLSNIFKRPVQGKENSILEYFPSYRTFPEGEVQLEIGDQGEDFFQTSRSGWYTTSKFQRLKQMILDVNADDKLRGENRFPELVEAIQGLLNRKLVVKWGKHRKGQILLENEDGELDLDSLSSGEKEILMTYFTIHTLRMNNSIILFDEPELHLHPSSQIASLNYLNKMSKEGNQIIIATHSPEFISKSPDNSLYHLKRQEGNQLMNIKEEGDKIYLFKKLGSTEYSYITYDKTVFVEGPVDKKILSKIKVTGKNLNYEIFYGGSHLTPDLLETISKLANVAMIKDRDFYSPSEIRAMQKKAPGKLYFWSRREIENFLLDLPALYEIHNDLGKQKLKNHSQFIGKIKEISDNYLEQTISDKFLFEKQEKINPPQPKLTIDQKALGAIEQLYKIRSDRITQLLPKLPDLISQTTSDLKSVWNDEWISHIDPKLVLSDLGNRFFEKPKSTDDLVEMVIIKLDSNNKFPKEFVEVIQKISQQ